MLYKTYYPYTTGTVGTMISRVYAQYSAQTYDYTYKYTDYDSTLSKIGLGDSNSYEYTYDELQRVTGKDLKNSSNMSIVNEDYTFIAGRNDRSNSTTAFVATKTVNSTVYTLSYDNLGRITQIQQSGLTNTTRYYYNDLGMLSREDNPFSAQTVMYYYGANANLTQKRIYAYTTASTPTGTYTTISYTYPTTSGGWNDRLTNFNGQSIAYNSIGQPTTYRGNTLTWTGLNLMAYGSNSYTYNVDGMRMSKTVGGVTTTFYREGNALIRQKNASVDIWFYYDDSGRIIGIKYNGTRYYYLNNAQGDVVGIVDINGNTVVTYTYDVWGKVISVGGSLASTLGANNPIRYRNYYYDTESNLYYLCSRYYDPEVCRFLSPDVIIGDGNLFAYCCNNPANSQDNSGHWLDTLLDAASLAWSVTDFVKDPSWENGAWMALDVVCLVVPFATGSAALKATVKTANAIDNVLDATKAVNRADDVVDVIRAGDRIDDTIDAGKAIGKIAGKSDDVIKASKPLQKHHYLTNKSSKFTAQFDNIVKKYGLDLNGSWNTQLMPHQGRHPNAYHEFMLDGVKKIDGISQGNTKVFLSQFDSLKQIITSNPEMLYKSFWR